MNRSQMRSSTLMAGRVKRYHTWPVHQEETVDHHSMGVLRVYREIFGLGDNMEVVRYIMDHDLPEISVGDLPFPIKREYPALKAAIVEAEKKSAMDLGLPSTYNLTETELVRVKVCDLLQMWQFGCVEVYMGNAFAVPIKNDALKAAEDLSREKLSTTDQASVDYWISKEFLS